MWLLNTRTCELRQFLSPELVPKGYAILSHCWGRDEQTFQDVQGHMASCAKTGKNPRDFVSKKIREFCVLAESLGYEWGWADTCCIDKTSSSELSEAINSMFRYYFLSEVCIVFLHDVPTGCALDEHGPEFRDSRWHKRGWTLQELIAPKNVVFYSQDWQKLSTKVEKAPLLEEITGIPEDVLMGKKGVTEMSVAARMSWAAYRETTREEDEAYCLLGILKVDMYTSYGEGRHAFYRLQEEFIKRSTDTSLFAWGKVLKMEDVRNLQDLRLPDTIAAHHKHDLSEPFLFAPSPACFRKRSGVSFAPCLSLGMTGCAFDISGFLTFTATPYGILAHFPVAELKSQRLLVAFIACSKDGHRLGLVLKACGNAEATSPNGSLYDVSFPNYRGIIRLVSLTREGDKSERLNFEWRDIYIRMRPSAGTSITLPDLKELEKEEEEEEEGSAPAIQTSPPTAVPPPSTKGPPLSRDTPPPSTNTPPPSTDAPLPRTSAPPPMDASSMAKDPHPSTRAPPLGTETLPPAPDAPPPPTTHVQPHETKERSATTDAPAVAVAQDPFPMGRDEGQGPTTRARRRESGSVAWFRSMLQRMVTVFGIPMTESS